MNILLALLLSQVQPLNINQAPILCMDEGAYCSARKTRAFELNCSGAGVTCTQTAGRMTVTVGAGSSGGGAPLDGGYLTLTAGSTGSSNEVVLSAGSNINITAGGVVSATGIPTDISAEPYITKTASANLSNEFALGTLATGLLINTTTTGVPTIKGANTCTNQFPRSDNASGTWTCASIATADLPTVPVTKGGTNLTTVAANQVLVGTAADTFTAKTVPSCSNGTTDKLLFDNSTQTWSCGTDQGGGSGLTSAEVSFYVLQGAF